MAVFNALKSFVWSRYFPWIIGVLTILILGVLFFWLGWLTSPYFWASFLLVLAAGVGAALRWEFLPKMQEWLFLRQQEHPRYIAAGGESPQAFLEKFKSALQTHQNLPQDLPWYLVIGKEKAGKTSVLQAMNPRAFLQPIAGGKGGTQNCDWWVSNTAIFLDTTGRYTSQADVARDRSEWYRLLRLLHHYRRQRPIHGVVIAVAMDSLLSQSEGKLREEGTQLRLRLKELVEELGVDFPVYLLVTKCDLLEGFRPFFAQLQLPERVRTEAFGYIYDPPLHPQSEQQAPATLTNFKAGLDYLYERLHLLRFALLNGGVTAEVRQVVFCFPEEFKNFTVALTTFAERIFQHDVLYYKTTPSFRGVFFASALPQGAPLSLMRRQLGLIDSPSVANIGDEELYFLNDFFNLILVKDRGLTHTTSREHARRRWRWSFTIVIVFLLTLLCGLPFWRAHVIDREILAAVNGNLQQCPSVETLPGSGPHFGEMECLRKAVQDLVSANAKRARWSKILSRASFKYEVTLRQRYVQQFQSAVLTPLYNRLVQAFSENNDTVSLLLFLAQRILLTNQCLKKSPPECVQLVDSVWQPDDYRLMLDPAHPTQFIRSEEVTSLTNTYAAYLLWQQESRKALAEELEADRKLLEQRMSGQFSLTSLLLWVNHHAQPLTYETYWQPQGPVLALPNPQQIDPACLKEKREHEIQSFLDLIVEAAPTRKPELDEFQTQQTRFCFQQWQSFLSRFSEGANWWKGKEGESIMQLLKADSPYHRVITQAYENLSPWIPAEGQPGNAPAWVVSLQHYATAQEQQQQKFLEAIRQQLDPRALPQSSFAFASDVFAVNQADETKNPLLQAWQVKTQDSVAEENSQQASDNVVKKLKQEQLRLVWDGILNQAGLHLQNGWRTEVVTPLQQFAPAERLIRLYDPGGVAGVFLKDLHPFLQKDETAARSSVIGGGLSFSPAFQQFLITQKQLRSIYDGTQYAVRVTATNTPHIDSFPLPQTSQSVFALACGNISYRVSTTPGETTQSIQWSYQGCGDASLTVYFVNSQGQELSVTKVYGGALGFVQFVQDFAGGSRRFAMANFPQASPAVFSLGIHGIDVYYRVEPSAILTKLLSVFQNSTLPMDIMARATSLS